MIERPLPLTIKWYTQFHEPSVAGEKLRKWLYHEMKSRFPNEPFESEINLRPTPSDAAVYNMIELIRYDGTSYTVLARYRIRERGLVEWKD